MFTRLLSRILQRFKLSLRLFLRIFSYYSKAFFHSSYPDKSLVNTGFSTNITLHRSDDLYIHFSKLINISLNSFVGSKKSYWLDLIPDNHQWYNSEFLSSWVYANRHLFSLAKSYLRADPVLVAINC